MYGQCFLWILHHEHPEPRWRFAIQKVPQNEAPRKAQSHEQRRHPSLSCFSGWSGSTTQLGTRPGCRALDRKIPQLSGVISQRRIFTFSCAGKHPSTYRIYFFPLPRPPLMYVSICRSSHVASENAKADEVAWYALISTTCLQPECIPRIGLATGDLERDDTSWTHPARSSESAC
jgi:hypothetical protein